MDDILSFFYKLIYTNLLEEMRVDFMAGKIEDTLLNKKYYNLSKWAEFGRAAENDTVMYIEFVRVPSYDSEDGFDSQFGSANFKDYLSDKISYELSLIIESILKKVDVSSFRLRTEDYQVIHNNISRFIADTEKLDSEYKSVVTEGLADLLDKLSSFKPEISKASSGNLSKLEPVNNNQLFRELSDFCNGLKGYGLIHNDTRISTFRAAFGFGNSEERIIWTGPKNALRELIIMLEREGKIKKLGNEKASVLSNIFEIENEPDYDFRKLKTNNDPYAKGEELKRLILYL